MRGGEVLALHQISRCSYQIKDEETRKSESRWGSLHETESIPVNGILATRKPVINVATLLNNAPVGKLKFLFLIRLRGDCRCWFKSIKRTKECQYSGFPMKQ